LYVLKRNKQPNFKTTGYLILKHTYIFLVCHKLSANILKAGREEPLGRPRRRWEDNIKMDLREIGFGDVEWIHWADRDRWRALVNTVMNLRVP
jgi:hypothetical protein